MKTQPLLTMTVSGNTPAEVITNAKKNIKALEDSLKAKTAKASAASEDDEDEIGEEEEETEIDDEDENEEESEEDDEDEIDDEENEEESEEDDEDEDAPPKKKAKGKTVASTSSGKTNPAKKALFAAAAKHTKFHKSRKKTLTVLSKFNCKSINEVPKDKYEAVTRALTKDLKK